jgi:hypothetical protein
MKRIGILCLVFVALVLSYNWRNSKSAAQPVQQQLAPQGPTTVRLNRIDSRGGASIQVSGRIIGFSCAANQTLNSECFVATTD